MFHGTYENPVTEPNTHHTQDDKITTRHSVKELLRLILSMEICNGNETFVTARIWAFPR